jgi:IclR family acetate operon transcriptional repressor
LKSVVNALRIAEAVAQHQPIGVGDLSRSLGLPKTSVQRALTTLGEAGWLRQEADGTGRWRLAARLLAFGRGSALQALRNRSLATMGRLRAETEETILLFVRDGDRVVAIEGLDGTKSVRAHTSVGDTAPLHASASGKAILAELPGDEVEAYIAGGLRGYTSETITDPRALRAELARTRKRGYATHRSEWLPDVAAVGAVIRGPDDRPEGAIVIAAPSDRMPRQRERQLGERAVAAARRIRSSV